jgi:dCTP deaminase
MLLSSEAILAAYDQGAIHFYSPGCLDQMSRLVYLLGDNPNSVDVTLGSEVREIGRKFWEFWKMSNLKGKVWRLDYPTYDLEGYPLEKGSFYLSHTEEFIGTTDKPFNWDGKDYYLTSQFDTRSTLARMGLPMHCSAGFGDCGFHGRWALEIAPVQDCVIDAGEKVGQVYFTTLCGTPKHFYESKYGQSNPDKWSFEESVLPRKGLST